MMRIPSHVELDDQGNGRIVGKGFKVYVLAALYKRGWSVDDLTEQYNLTPAEVHAGLSYYYDHREEIDRANLDGNELAKQIGVSGVQLINRLKARESDV